MNRRRGGMSLGRVAKKAAVATVVSRAINNRMDNSTNQNLNQGMTGESMNRQPQKIAMNNICPSCHTGNPEDAKFCLNCGNGLVTVEQAECPGCKADLTGVNGNFCPYCRSAIK